MTAQTITQIEIPPAAFEVSGKTYVRNAKGGMDPIETVKPQHLLEDETVRKVLSYAIPLSEQVARFKQHTFDDVSSFEAILAQEYDTTVGGKRGNKTLMSIDQLYKIEVRVSDQIAFGPELQTAKELVDQCLNEWAEEAGPELRSIVTAAFNTDKAGQINRSEIFMLLRRDIKDPRWVRAMQAIRDAIRVVGSKTYVRAYRRETIDAHWQAVTIDLAKA